MLLQFFYVQAKYLKSSLFIFLKLSIVMLKTKTEFSVPLVTEALARSCSVKEVFLKFSKIFSNTPVLKSLL